MLAVIAVVGGCAGEVTTETCPEGTVREANRCQPSASLAQAVAVDAGPVPDAGPRPDAGPQPDAGSLPDAGEGPVALPFYVDAHFAMSGYFPGPPGVVDVLETCPGVQGTAAGSVCRRITFTPNGATFGGFYFQSPADNWGAEPGLEVAPGATQVTFRAWGAVGGESMKFGAGIDNQEPNADGWNIESAAMLLGTTPTELSVSLSGIVYDRVVGGFLWVVETPDGTTPVTFFLDNVRWQ